MRTPMLLRVLAFCVFVATVHPNDRDFGVDECAFCGASSCPASCFKTCGVAVTQIQARDDSVSPGDLAFEISDPGQSANGAFEDDPEAPADEDRVLRKRPGAKFGRGFVVVNEESSVSVLIRNAGEVDETDVEVQLLNKPWGLAFAGNGTDLFVRKRPGRTTYGGASNYTVRTIGVQQTNIPAGGSQLLTFPYSFLSRASTGLEVRVNRGFTRERPVNSYSGRVSEWDVPDRDDQYSDLPDRPDGIPDQYSDLPDRPHGIPDQYSDLPDWTQRYDPVDRREELPRRYQDNSQYADVSDLNVGCTDRSQSNVEVVHSGPNASIRLPIVNDRDYPVLLRPAFRCREGDHSRFGYCPNVDLFVPNYNTRNGTVLLQPREAISALVRGINLPEGSLEVAFYAQDQVSGEVEEARLQLEVSEPEAVLNAPLLCCIASVRVRVLLESVLALALRLLEGGDAYNAMQLLRRFLREGKELLCDALSYQEKSCLERAMVAVLDAARMIAASFGLNRALAATADAESLTDNPATEVQAIERGDEFRAEGLYEEAVLAYARAPEKRFRRSLPNGARTTGRRLSMRNALSSPQSNPLYEQEALEMTNPLYEG